MKKGASKSKKMTKKAAQKKARSSAKESTLQSVDPEEQRQRIEEKAYELYESRGYEHGNDQGNWYEAEEIISSGGARVEQ